jgi:hypothetical protein
MRRIAAVLILAAGAALAIALAVRSHGHTGHSVAPGTTTTPRPGPRPRPSGPRAVVRDGRVLLDGKPFFPILQWLQCPSVMDKSVRLGITVFLSGDCSGSKRAELAAASQRGVLSVLDAPPMVDGSSLIGWHFQDEPDGHGIPPSTIAKEYAQVRGHGLAFLNLNLVPWRRQLPTQVYKQYARSTDLVGAGIYPVTGWCRPDWLPRVGETQRALIAIADGRPTYQWIEASATSLQYCAGRGVTPEELRAEVWDAIVNGAKGIGYFTHSWTPTYDQFRVSPDVQAEIKRTNREVGMYTSAILGTPVPLRIKRHGGRIEAMARRAAGTLYLFAVNVGRTSAAADLTLDGGTRKISLPPLGVSLGTVASSDLKNRP